MLAEIDRREAALAAYDGAIVLADDSEEPLVQEQLISASYRKALALRAWGRFGESVEVVARLLNTFIPMPPAGGTPIVLARPESLPDIAGAFLLFPTLAGDLGQSDRVIPMYDQMIAILGEQDDIGVRAAVGRARLSKAALLGRGGQLTEAIEMCDELLLEIDGSEHPSFVILRALALADRGHWLKAAGRGEDATSSFRAVVDGFQFGQDEEIDAALVRAQQELT